MVIPLDRTLKRLPLDLASGWILNSSIQSEKGGFYAWYDSDKGEYPYLYSEISGYGITALLFLSKLFGADELIGRARMSADWLIRTSLHPSGGVRTRLYKNDETADETYSFSAENIFSFDTGMVLNGMINLHGVTSEKRFLETAGILAEFLIKNMQNRDGSLSAVYNAKKKTKIVLKDNKWSSQSGPFHAKVSMGLADLFEITGNTRYKNAAIKICEYALTRQNESGRFITDNESGTTNLHPHCYAAEGLLYAGRCFDIPDFIKSSGKAAEWIFSHISPRGINELYDPHTNAFNDLRRSDVLAQALRLGLLHSFDQGIEDLRAVLLEHQDNSDDKRRRGGFYYSLDRQDINSWCTMFAVQALAYYQHRRLMPNGKKAGLFI